MSLHCGGTCGCGRGSDGTSQILDDLRACLFHERLEVARKDLALLVFRDECVLDQGNDRAGAVDGMLLPRLSALGRVMQVRVEDQRPAG